MPGGYTRILGELKKLGIRVSRSTVVNILKEAGLDPGPKRGEGTWDEFITRHAQTLWACDFFSARTWTLRGVVEVYILFFIHVGTRRVLIAGVSTNPDRIWTAQQARNMSMVFADMPDRPKLLIRDLDSKFGPEFDDVLRSDGIDVVKVGPRKPNLNAFAERWVQTCKTECLDHFLIFGEAHMRHLLSRFTRFYNELRPHQSLGNRLLSGPTRRATIIVPRRTSPARSRSAACSDTTTAPPDVGRIASSPRDSCSEPRSAVRRPSRRSGDFSSFGPISQDSHSQPFAI
jgi:putative transposase